MPVERRGDPTRASRFLAEYREHADVRLMRLLDARTEELRSYPAEASSSFGMLREYVLRGGKRIRGALVLLGAEACGADSQVHLDASLSFELLQAYLLAFDDVMDRDETRRGGPALHVVAARRARVEGRADPEHEGASVAHLLGLLAQSLAFRCVSSADLDVGVRGRAMAWLLQVHEGVVLGQLLDVRSEGRPDADEELSWVRRLKTGLYTFEGPLLLGAILAGAPPDDPRMEALRRYANPLGEAFQIVDDVLGAVGEIARTGKPAADLQRGRGTAVISDALKRLGGADAARFRELIGRPLSGAELEEAACLVRASGAVDSALALARRHADEAVAAIETAAFPPDVVERLIDLAQLVVVRDA